MFRRSLKPEQDRGEDHCAAVGLFAALVSSAVLLPSASIAWAGLVVDAAVILGVVLAVAAVHRSSRSAGTGTKA